MLDEMVQHVERFPTLVHTGPNILPGDGKMPVMTVSVASDSDPTGLGNCELLKDVFEASQRSIEASESGIEASQRGIEASREGI